jgi:hypothetical protein
MPLFASFNYSYMRSPAAATAAAAAAASSKLRFDLGGCCMLHAMSSRSTLKNSRHDMLEQRNYFSCSLFNLQH